MSDSCADKPWYAIRCCREPPTPISTIKRPWINEQLVTGWGCPDIARCGTMTRDGDGCRYPLDNPNASYNEVPSRPRHQGHFTPSSGSTMETGSAQGSTASVSSSGEGKGTTMTPSSGSSSPSHSGTVGIHINTPGAFQNVQLFTPESLRNYAMWWSKQWSLPFQCSGYEGICMSMGCQGVGKLREYASGWATQWGSGDLTTADRNRPLSRGNVGDPQTAITRYFMATEACMQANDWKACAEHGDLMGLRAEAIRQGVLPSMLDPALGLMGQPNADQRGLLQSIYAMCSLNAHGAPSVCATVARSVTDAAMKRAGWLLTGSGKDLQAKIEQASARIHGNQTLFDPQQFSEAANPVLQQAWRDAIAALSEAWTSSRYAMDLPVERRRMDFATPLMQYLLANGWSTNNSLKAEHSGSRVWLIGTNASPLSIDPGKATSSMWPWAAGYERAVSAPCWQDCRESVRQGLFALYSLLRLEPLQAALKQGLRDISVMVITDKLPAR